MEHIARFSLVICSILLSTACEGASLDIIVCQVGNAGGPAPAGLADHLCEAAAKATNAREVSASEMKAALSSPRMADQPEHLHVVEVAFPSDREIAFSYSYGTAAEWNDHREKRFDDLHIDVMDAELNPATVGMFADTIRRLSP